MLGRLNQITNHWYDCNSFLPGFFQHCNLKRHMISHSLEDGAEGFKCQHCKASFTTKSVLSVHMRDAHGDKLVTKKEQRNSGTKTPTEEMTLGNVNAAKLPLPPNPTGTDWSRCGVCHKNFLTAANLKQHMLLHEGRKPFKCNFCGLR